MQGQQARNMNACDMCRAEFGMRYSSHVNAYTASYQVIYRLLYRLLYRLIYRLLYGYSADNLWTAHGNYLLNIHSLSAEYP